MSENLNEFLVEKRQALLQRQQVIPTGPNILRASTRAEGRSGVRRIRIRDFQIISDSGPDFAGYNLGPSSPELQLGVLSSCITHVFLIQAAQLQVPLDSLEVEIQGEMDGRAGKPGFENVPIWPHNITYTVHLSSSASDEELAQLHAAVERSCPILNLLINPQQINGSVVRTASQQVVSQVK
jgi:uncharacterized OsmC-like protein